MACAVVAITVLGFAPSYYLLPVLGGAPLPPIVHLHGLVFSAWVLLYALQTGLVATRHTQLHRQLGVGAAVLAPLMLVLGFVTAVVTARLPAHEGRIGPPIIFPFTAVSMFAALTVAGMIRRRRPQEHKRLMLLGTVSLLTTPLARIGRMIGAGMPPPIFGIVGTDVLLGALVAYDIASKGRVERVTLIGGGAFVLSQVARVWLAHLPAWQAFAKSIGAH